MSNVRSKFKCTSKTEFEHGSFEVKFMPVYGDSPENKRFWEATPNGELGLGGLKREVANLYTVGCEYFLDMTLAMAS